MTDPLTEVIETIERRHARKAQEVSTAPSAEELAKWSEMVVAATETETYMPHILAETAFLKAAKGFVPRLLDALEAAQKLARDSHERYVDMVGHSRRNRERAEQAERERDAARREVGRLKAILLGCCPDDYYERHKRYLHETPGATLDDDAAQPAAPATEVTP